MSRGRTTRQDNSSWLGHEAPRYTSYPSAHHFSPGISAAQHGEWLEAMEGTTSVSAYIHIPFCRELCWFCGCHTKMTKRYKPIAAYVQLLLKEIALIKRYTGGKGRLVNVHFGGGSPSLLGKNDLRAILEAVTGAFGKSSPGELAIELDPRTTTPENILLYASLGFNRISLGIQDFDPAVQQAINRIQPFPMVASLVNCLRSAGLGNINFDLIYGLPHQTPERFRATLDKVIALDPTRVALFSYAHMPHLKKHQRLIDPAWLPSGTDKLSLYRQAQEMLTSSGYTAVGIDHFAKASDPLALAVKKGTLQRNFQGYVTDGTDVILGIGSSAISQFPQGYAQNSASAVDYRNYLEKGKLPTARGWDFQGDDRFRKLVIDRLMCFMCVDLAEIRNAFGLEKDWLQPELETLKQPPYQEIVAADKDCIRMTTPYRMAARVVAAVFDRYAGRPGSYSKVA